MPTAACPVPPSCQPCSGIHAHAVKTWSKSSGEGGEAFPAEGMWRKAELGRSAQSWAEGKECGQQQNHSTPAQQREKAKSSKESPLDNGTQKAFSSSGRFLHHQQFPCPSLAVGSALHSSQCTQQALPVHPTCQAGCQPRARWHSGQPSGTQWLAGMWLWVCFRGTKVGTAANSTPAVVVWHSQGVLQVPNSSCPPLQPHSLQTPLAESPSQVCPHRRF